MLSVIIVNYNVKYFTGQCLYSVQKAISGINAEVIVIDNNSSDESVAWLKEKFPWIKLIANAENTGYAKANNLGWQMANGDTVLFLNPDTIIAEHCLENAMTVLQQDAQIGALGLRMIDGTGHFLPESKRGFPSPAASFFKLSGLIKISPHHRNIAQYYMGWLPANKNNEVEVLSGACMMVKKAVLEKTGGFDEQFFMYGEDIDLSYRIRQAGYKNHYLGETTIIHFKGESTPKDARHAKLFYQAMNLFVKKHYQKKSWVFNLFIQTGIGLSGGLSFFTRAFTGSRSAKTVSGNLHTLLAGAPPATEKAAAILAGNLQVKRQISYARDITAIYSVVKAGKTDEIVFCEGGLTYTAIITCMEQLSGKLQYRFFAAGSIIGSLSKNSIGEILPA